MTNFRSKYPNGVPIEFSRVANAEIPSFEGNSFEDIEEVHSRLTSAWKTGKTRPFSYRRGQINSLRAGLIENYDLIIEAMVRDLKSPGEAVIEYHSAVQEADDFLDHLESWGSPVHVSPTLAYMADTTKIVLEPYGAWLNISPWNFPFLLAITPLIGSIGAGNVCVLKPSELSPNTSMVVKMIIEKYLDSECFAVLNGGKDVATKILELKWDHILYTGNGTVARIVMAAAAKHLTPVTLELGGKCPAIIDDKTCDLRVAARRVVWGRFLNAGQLCISVDHVIVHPSIKEEFVQLLKEETVKLYSADASKNSEWPKMISEHHVKRVSQLLPSMDSPASHGRIVYGGKYNASERYFEPTIITDVNPFEAPLMSGEIFGPILPVIEMDSLEDTISYLQSKDKPLALYIFSDDKYFIDALLTNISSGAACVNDVISHFLNPTLPFGGVGESGMGHYHGKLSLEQFSHKRAILLSPHYRYLERILAVRYSNFDLFNAIPLNFSSTLYPNAPNGSVINRIANKVIGTLSWTKKFASVLVSGRADGKTFN